MTKHNNLVLLGEGIFRDSQKIEAEVGTSDQLWLTVEDDDAGGPENFMGTLYLSKASAVKLKHWLIENFIG